MSPRLEVYFYIIWSICISSVRADEESKESNDAATTAVVGNKTVKIVEVYQDISRTGVRVTWKVEGEEFLAAKEFDILFTAIKGPRVNRMTTNKKEFILNFTRPVKYEVEISPRLSYLEQKGDVHIISKKTTIVAEEQTPPPPKDLKVVQGQSAKEIIVTFKPVPKEDLYGVDKGCEVRACESIHLNEKCVTDRGDRGEKKFYLQLPKYNVLYYVAAACATGAGMGPFSHFVTIQIEAPPWATEDVLPKGTEPPSPKPRKGEDDLKPLRLHDVIVDLVAHRGMNIILKWIIVRKDGSDIADSQVKDVMLYQRRRDKSSKTPTNASIKVVKDLREINIGLSPGFKFDLGCYSYSINVTFTPGFNHEKVTDEVCYSPLSPGFVIGYAAIVILIMSIICVYMYKGKSSGGRPGRVSVALSVKPQRHGHHKSRKRRH
ncbi:hypothetical protein Q1695_008153 [Nippostrongylus brasiliensis]|nr:hypothetical protein Q1695_008153 [Nippostrongylus brasiliensis]